MTVAPLPFIVLAAVAAAVAAYVLTPLAGRVATVAGAIDLPDSGRRVHREPIPRAGGLAVAAALLTVATLALLMDEAMEVIPAGRIEPIQILALLGGVALAAGFGFIDDRWQIRARWQLVLQVLLALFAVVLGVTITGIDNPFDVLGGPFASDTLVFGGAAAVIVTTLWIVGMINSINFIDGLDGLSTGVSLIAAITLGVISLPWLQDQPIVALLCAVLAGSLAGFLPWNFHPARIFIGTTGVYVAGYALAVLSILGTAKVAAALLVLGVPIIDTFWIITRRLLQKRSPFTPDRGHIHHRLLDLGLTHRGAVMLIYVLCIGLALASVLLTGSGPIYAFLGIVVGFGLLLFLMTRRAGGDDALDARTYGDDPPRDVSDPTPRGRDTGTGSAPVGR